MGRGIRRAQGLVVLEPLRHLAHDPLALQGRQGTGQLRAGGVERRGERRAVGQARLSAHDIRLATGAPVSDLGDAADLAPELPGHGFQVGRIDGRQVVACAHRRAPGASAVRADSQTPWYQGSSSSDEAMAANGSRLPASGSGSSTVYDFSPGLTNFSRCRACCST